MTRQEEAFKFWIVVALSVLTLGLYYKTCTYSWVMFDDDSYVLENPYVSSGLHWKNIVWAFTQSHSANWHPLTWISHMLDCSLWGIRSGPMHLVNASLHTTNVVLLFLLLHNMTGALWRSALVAALFAWHPLHVESVAWISERKDVLSTLFWLLTTVYYVRYTRNSSPANFVKICVFFSLGLMCKPMLVTLPFTLLLLDIWPLRRMQCKGGHLEKTAALPIPTTDLLKEKIPLFALSLISCVVTFIVQRQAGAVSDLRAVPLPLRIENATVNYIRYLAKMFWPSDLIAFYPFPNAIALGTILSALILLLAISALVLWQWRKRPQFLVGWFWYLGTLVPVIGLVQVGGQSLADRYTYIPLIGIFIALVWGLAELATTFHVPRFVCGLVSTAVLAFLFCASAVQIPVWKDSISLFSKVLRVAGPTELAYNNLGYALFHIGRFSESREQIEKALELWPEYPEAHFNLGNLLLKERSSNAAISEFEKVLAAKPRHAEASFNLGALYAEKGDLDLAIKYYKTAIASKPDYVEAYNNLGATYANNREYLKAIECFKMVLQLQPDSPEARANLDQLHSFMK